jgi:hypothetical protein
MTTKAQREAAAKAKAQADEEEQELAEEEAAEQEADEDEEEEQGQPPTGPTQTPVYDPAAPVEPATVPAAEPESDEEAGGNVVDDGIEDIALPAPVLGQWVRITDGDYSGRFAAYLGNVELDRDGDPTVIQVRTRDADNLLLDVGYDDVESTAYSGGR